MTEVKVFVTKSKGFSPRDRELAGTAQGVGCDGDNCGGAQSGTLLRLPDSKTNMSLEFPTVGPWWESGW
jgi:hypothetical protein